MIIKLTGIIFFIFLLIIPLAAYGQTAAPRIEPGDCAVPVRAGERVECFSLIVPENRSRKSGKTIRLPVIILKSDNADPKPDPVLRTLGGPGGSSLRMVSGRRFSPWLKDRDMIVFEQRGTKYAQPALECPEVGEAAITSAKQQLNTAKAKKSELKAVRACRERLVRRGIDLAAYNSAESAADIEDLRRLLKLEKINLYGVSYSARLMLNVMRDYPAGVRSVVMESTLPLEVNYDEAGVDGVARALDLLFAKCAADPACAAAFPQLESDFYAFVKKANSAPIPVSVNDGKTGETILLKLTGHDIVTWLGDYALSSDGRAIAAAPGQIARVVKGDYAPLQDYAGSKLGAPFYSLGMRYSVWCREEMPFEDRAKIAAQSTRYPKLEGYEVQNLPAICRVWDIPRAETRENLPVKSDIPTLILAGEYDVYTPPAWGRSAAANLKNSFFFEVPWAGHGPGFNSPPCLGDMVAEFFNDPATRPNSACLEKIGKYFKFAVKKP
jgi:pimeloyl-ACP methyl ester carboxylesterase